PDLAEDVDDRGRRLRPVAEDLRLLGGALREGEPDLLELCTRLRRPRRRAARSFAGTDGYRGRLSPSFTVTTAGTGSTNTSRPPGTSCSQRTCEPSTARPFSPFATGRPSA